MDFSYITSMNSHNSRHRNKKRISQGRLERSGKNYMRRLNVQYVSQSVRRRDINNFQNSQDWTLMICTVLLVLVHAGIFPLLISVIFHMFSTKFILWHVHCYGQSCCSFCNRILYIQCEYIFANALLEIRIPVSNLVWHSNSHTPADLPSDDTIS